MSPNLVQLLLIEDNPGDVRLIELMLNDSGREKFRLTVANRLATGKSLLQEQLFDLVLLDLTLPDGYGLMTFRELLKLAPNLPIVVFSGLDDEGMAIQMVQNGAQDYLVKGQVDGNLLVRSIYYAIERKQAEMALQKANRELASWVNELEQRNIQMTLLNQLTEGLQRCMSHEDAYLKIKECLPLMFLSLAGVLGVTKEAGAHPEVVVQWNLMTDLLLDRCLTECVGQGRTQPYWHQGSDLKCPWLARQPIIDAYCIPLSDQETTFGLLAILADEDLPGDLLDHGRIPESTRRLAVTAAETIALTLANLRLREELHFQAIHDPLTGLYNRRYMIDSLEREIHKAQRMKAPIGVVMMDIDRFKNYNDIYLHSGGDALLRELGALLIVRTRGGDIACRYGGEEFVLILPGATLEDTFHRAEEIRQRANQLDVVVDGKHLGTISFSVGVVVYPQHGETADQLFHNADTALYAAKEAGRNCVIRAPLPIA
jgi:diguanylate cyclase (GGDEF)-like protein